MPRFPARPAGSEHVGLINTGSTFRVRKRHQPHVYTPTLWSLACPEVAFRASQSRPWLSAGPPGQRYGRSLHWAAWSMTPNSWCPSKANAWPSSEPPPSLSSDPQPCVPFLCHPGLNYKYFGHDSAFAGCQGIETVKQVASLSPPVLVSVRPLNSCCRLFKSSRDKKEEKQSAGSQENNSAFCIPRCSA